MNFRSTLTVALVALFYWVSLIEAKIPNCVDGLPMVGCCKSTGDFTNNCGSQTTECEKVVQYNKKAQCKTKKKKVPNCVDGLPMVGCCKSDGSFSNVCGGQVSTCSKKVDYNKPAQCKGKKRKFG